MSEIDLLFENVDAVPADTQNTAPPWTLLIIDDDPEVHAATRLALLDTTFQNRPLAFVSAFSAAQARELLPTLQNVAIVLLEVVMETDDAGLTLVRFIREELNWQATRIILRTGQPGSAPEHDVILQYDINDYKAKTDLTQTRLFTAVIVALRGYRHLINLETSLKPAAPACARSSAPRPRCTAPGRWTCSPKASCCSSPPFSTRKRTPSSARNGAITRRPEP